MKALVYYGPRDLRIEEREIPKPSNDEVLIKVRAVSACGSDLGAYRLPEICERWFPPLVLGHEFSGEIVELGANVDSLHIGQRVTGNPILYCNDCFYCNNNMINLCTKRHSLGTSIGGEAQDGAMQEYFTLRKEAVIPLDDRLTFAQGALLEPLAVCYCAAQKGITKDERVAVIGAGPIGLMTVKFLKAFGAKTVIASDISDIRLDIALKYGADAIVNVRYDSLIDRVRALTDDVGVERVIIAADTTTAIDDSLKIVRSGGNIVMVALMHHNITFDPMQIVGRSISILGSYMFTWQQKDVMQMVAEGKLFVDDLITSTHKLEEGVEVFKELCSGDCKDVKVLITM
jgi:2-desacetyl-2-hydroxyethyl bacteriochlorophyllide A dehydrogenase